MRLLGPGAGSKGGNREAGEPGKAGKREREGWRLAPTETPAPAKRSLFWRSNYLSHRCVCVGERERYRETERVCVYETVCYPKAPGPRSPRGRQPDQSSSPATVRPDLLPSGTELLGAVCHDPPCHGPRAPGCGQTSPQPHSENRFRF